MAGKQARAQLEREQGTCWSAESHTSLGHSSSVHLCYPLLCYSTHHNRILLLYVCNFCYCLELTELLATLLCAIYHCYTSTQRVSQQATQGNSAPHRFTTPSLCEKWRVPTTNALNIEHRANNNDRINTSTLIFRCGLLHAKIHRSPLLPH